MDSSSASVVDRLRLRLAALWRLGHRRPQVRHLILAVAVAGFAVAAAGLWLVWPFLSELGQIGGRPDDQPSRLYGLPLELRVGQPMTAERLVAELRELGYHRAPDSSDPADQADLAADAKGVEGAEGDERESARTPAGRFRLRPRYVAVRLRRHMAVDGPRPGRLIEVFLAGSRIDGLRVDGRRADWATLDEPILASFYGDDVRERWPVVVDELPGHVVRAVLAAEDHDFFLHQGLSPVGIARAAWTNLRSGGVAQGGSTLTQQLVKNVFLTHERSWLRKAREAVLATLVEMVHSKPEILQAYLNEIYLGSGNGVNYHGLGTAARAYFSKDPSELTLEEAALLAGMIPAPADYSPVADPEAARAQRDRVLGRMAELGWLEPERLDRALAAPVVVVPGRVGVRRAPYFANAVAAEARERFGVERLGDRGYHLFSTLSPVEQAAAERAVSEGLAALGRDDLEAALVAIEPQSGAVRAWVGGHDYAASQFDRVADAHRQAGSVFKPVVFAAALEAGKVSPATRVEDAPLVVPAGSGSWRPQNYDRRFRGLMTARTAVEDSRNIPLVQMAMDIGLDRVVETAHRLGLAGPMEEVPALALGAAEVTPAELAAAYATFAAGGRRPTVHGLTAVYDADGEALEDGRPPATEEAISPQVAFITTSVLEGVVERGTGTGLGRYRVAGPLAGKTGTSNDGRDNWFAGYRPDRAIVVWVGHDTPRATPFSGSRAALPIWGRFAATLPPPAQDEFREPPGLEHARVCRVSGLVARPVCPALDEVFLPGQVPEAVCDIHRAARRQPQAGRERRARRDNWLERKLKKIFGGG